MKPENFDIQELIDHLQGTCKSLQEGLNDLYPEMDVSDLTEKDNEEIDNQIFNCDTCNWWCEACEQDEDGNCENCSTQQEEE